MSTDLRAHLGCLSLVRKFHDGGCDLTQFNRVIDIIRAPLKIRIIVSWAALWHPAIAAFAHLCAAQVRAHGRLHGCRGRAKQEARAEKRSLYAVHEHSSTTARDGGSAENAWSN